MSEIGSSAAVGIEGVEWLDAGAGNLTVRVTGRWRRRRGWGAGGSGFRTPAVLVVEADGLRHRFPAMPEPPSLSGAAPGTWRLSFSVPGELAPKLGGHAYLTLGTVTIALPVPESGASERSTVAPPPPAAPPPPERMRAEPMEPPTVVPEPVTPEPSVPEPVASEPDPGPEPAPPRNGGAGASLEIERAWQRADEAERAAAVLGDRVGELEQALAEETLRHELTERSADVAERAERERRDRATVAEAARLRAEAALRSRRPRARARVPAEPSATVPAPESRQGGAGLPEADLVTALRRELGTRVTAEAALRARLVQAETRLAARVLLEQRTQATLQEIRRELTSLRDELERERAARVAAEAEAARIRSELGGSRVRSRDVSDAITEIRGALEDLRGTRAAPAAGSPVEVAEQIGPTPAAPNPSGEVSPERLSDALARLRDAREPRDLAPVDVGSEPGLDPQRPPGGPTLDGPFRRLVRRDPEKAGRLLVDLLAAQRVAYPHPVAYDLVLGPGRGCVQVTVGDGAPRVVVSGAARTREQVDFQIVGDPARLARLITAGPLRRLLRVGIARVRGSRDGLTALRALLSLPLDLTALTRAGMRTEPDSLLALVAAMIDPAWTLGERFTVVCGEDVQTACLQIRDGEPPLAASAPAQGRVAVTLRGEGPAIVRTLTSSTGDAEVLGDESALAVLRRWIQAAQSG